MFRFANRLLSLAVVAGTAVAVTTVVAASGAHAASLQEVTGFGSNPSQLRMYVYKPDGLPARPALVVAPHYCHGTGPEFFNGSGLGPLADKYKFVLIFPSTTQTSDQCFDVASAAALRRNGGSDPVGIMSMITYAEKTYGADSNRVFATGVSSGAMMTNVLLGDYPDVFKAGAAFAGVPYTCFSGTSSWSTACANGNVTKTAQQWGDAVRNNNPGYAGPWPRVMLWHGTADATLSYHNFGEEIKQWTNVHGLSQTPSSTATVSNNVTRTRYNDASGQTRVEAYSMPGVTHNLPYNAAAAISFFGLDGTATPPPATPVSTPTPTRTPTPTPTRTPTPTPTPTRTPPVSTAPVSTPPVSTRPATTTPVPPPTTAVPTGQIGCSATFTVSNAWQGGFVGAVKVTAGASPISGWRVSLTVPSGTSIVNIWNGAQTGTTVTNVAWNGSLAAGGTTEFGFQGTGSATGLTAASCSVA